MVRTISKMLAPLQRQIRLMITRGVVSLIDDATLLQSLQLSGLWGETISNAERFQQYGFSGYPHPGAEAIMLNLGGSRRHVVVIAVDDRRYRVHLQEGEVAMYDDLGQMVKLGRAGIDIEAPSGTIHTGNLAVDGNLSVTGLLTAANIDIPAGGDITIGGISFNGHKHGSVQPGSGVSGGPQ
jgi:phage baseplate assembly protein V